MFKVDLKKIKKIRKKHNVDILKRMKDGESLRSFDSNSSWFPPRPLIAKDHKAIAKLYNKKNLNTNDEKDATTD